MILLPKMYIILLVNVFIIPYLITYPSCSSPMMDGCILNHSSFEIVASHNMYLEYIGRSGTEYSTPLSPCINTAISHDVKVYNLQ